MVALSVIRDRVIQFIQLVRDPREQALIAMPQFECQWLNSVVIEMNFSEFHKLGKLKSSGLQGNSSNFWVKKVDLKRYCILGI